MVKGMIKWVFSYTMGNSMYQYIFSNQNLKIHIKNKHLKNNSLINFKSIENVFILCYS